MFVGYASNGGCFPTVSAAAVDYLSHLSFIYYGSSIQFPSQISTIGSVLSAAGAPDYVLVNFIYPSSTGAPAPIAVGRRFYQCDTSHYVNSDWFPGYTSADYVTVGWAVAGCWIITACVMALVRARHG